MGDKRIFVEVTEDESRWLALVLRDAKGHPLSADRLSAISLVPNVSEHRLADRFDLAATNSDEPVPFCGRAVFIGREMT